jgi:hypothetical protein
MQLVRKANAPRSTGATILEIVWFDIDYRMNAPVSLYNQKIREGIRCRFVRSSKLRN